MRAKLVLSCHFYFFLLTLLLTLLFFTACSKESTQPKTEEPPTSPTLKLSDFSSAETCKDCHPTQYNEWRRSMHAYAFIDPVNTLWMEGVRSEVGTKVLGTFCVQCHSPIGTLTGELTADFDKDSADPLIKEGITCDVCHLMSAPSPTANPNTVYHYDVTSGNRYGSIEDPAANSFHTSSYNVMFHQSDACLPCHDLINRNGLLAEITFTEWVKSPYSPMGVECQTCHMETYSGQAAINGPVRENLHRHDFIGVDIALLDNFPGQTEMRQKIAQLLQNAVDMTVTAPETVAANGTLNLKCRIKNDRTGHDIPSSVTFVRQMWLEVTVTSGSDTLYKSGYFDANGDLMDSHSELNPNGDPDLVMFQSSLYLNGQPANVFTADSISMGSIPAFQSRTGSYQIPITAPPGSALGVKVRLRFRTFPPYSLRGGGEQFIPKIPIFEMESWESTVYVN